MMSLPRLSEAAEGHLGVSCTDQSCSEACLAFFLGQCLSYFISGRAKGVHWVGEAIPDVPLEGFFVNRR